MDVSLSCHLMGISSACRVASSTADRFIPFRRKSMGPCATLATTDEENSNCDEPPSNPKPNTRTSRRNSVAAVSSGEYEAIRRQGNFRETQRRSERLSSSNSLDNGQRSSLSWPCPHDESAEVNQGKPRVLNFFSPENGSGRRKSSTGRRSSLLYSPDTFTPTLEEEITSTPPKPGRRIPAKPEHKKDLPEIREDIFSHVLSWGKKGQMAVAIHDEVFISDPEAEDLIEPIAIRPPPPPPFSFEVTPPRNAGLSSASDVTAVEWDPVGTKLAFGNERGYVWLWDSAHPDLASDLLFESGITESASCQVSSLAWMPHSTGSPILFVGTMDSRIESISVKDHICSHVKRLVRPICNLTVSPDGRYLAAAAMNERNGVVHIICTKTYEVTWKLKPHIPFTLAIAWCPWQPWVLATGGLADDDGAIKVWSISSKKLLHETTAGAQVTDLVWSENTMEIISAHGGNSTRVLVWPWNLSSEPIPLGHHKSRVLCLDMGPEGKKLATASGFDEEMLCIWGGFGKEAGTRKRVPSYARSPLNLCIR